VARLEQAGRHAGALARLADEDDGKIAIEIVEARFNLVHRDVDSTGDMAGSELGAGTHVNEQGWGGWVTSQLRYGYGGIHISSYQGRAGVLAKGFKPKDHLSWEIVIDTPQSIVAALGIEERYRVSYWGALILHAAESCGAAVLYSEGLADGLRYGGVEVVDPLRG